MILQALKEYYDRKAADPESGIAPEGWEKKEIPFVIVIDREGNLVQIEDTREGEGKKKRARSFVVPQGVKKTSGVAANLLWDVAGYVFGIDTKGKPERALEQKEAFITRIEKELSNIEDVKPVLQFLKDVSINRLRSEANWAEIAEKNSNMSFRFADEQMLICQSDAIRDALSSGIGVAGKNGRCLVSGKECPIVPLHASIKGVYGAQSSGANIVSFNLDAFRSFNKEQGYNAPVGESTSFAYTTALNTLLGRDSKQRMTIGDASTVFWSEKKTTFESDFSFFFSEPPKDDPDAGTRKVRALFESVSSGAYCNDDSDSHFYVLGLAPNAARIAVRFWQVGTIGQFAEKIRQHFEDIEIDHAEFDTEYCTLNELLSSVATETKDINKKNRVYFRGKYYDVPPNLAGSVLESILNGSPYPITLLHQCMRRIRAEVSLRNQNGKLLMNVTRARAAILKASINRFNRFYNPKKKEVTMGLDIESKDVGYLLGRLFAVLERVQIQSAGGEGKLNATIRDRFYGAFSSSPVTVMPMLLKLKNHHLAKIGSSKGFFEGLIGQVMDGLDALKIPSHLTLEQQAHLAVGYYHQRQDLFPKK